MKNKQKINKLTIISWLTIGLMTIPLICLFNPSRITLNTLSHVVNTKNIADGSISLDFFANKNTISKNGDDVIINATIRGDLDDNNLVWNYSFPQDCGVVANNLETKTLKLTATKDIEKDASVLITAKIGNISDSVRVRLITPFVPPIDGISLTFYDNKDFLTNANETITINATTTGSLDPEAIVWDYTISSDSGVTASNPNKQTLKLTATKDIEENESFLITATIGKVNANVSVKLVPPIVPPVTPIIVLSYTDNKNILMIKNDKVVIHADIENFDAKDLVWKFDSFSGVDPSYYETNKIDDLNYGITLLKNSTYENLSANLTASYGETNASITINMNKFNLNLTNSGLDWLSTKDNKTIINIDSNYFDLDNMPVSWKYDETLFDQLGIEVTTKNNKKLELLASKDIGDFNKLINITASVYDTDKSINIHVIGFSPVSLHMIDNTDNKNGVLANPGDIIEIGAIFNLKSKNDGEYKWHYDDAGFETNGIKVVENTINHLVLEATKVIEVEAIYKISMTYENDPTPASIDVKLSQGDRSVLQTKFNSDNHTLAKIDDSITISTEYYSPNVSQLSWSFDHALLDDYGVKYEIVDDSLKLTATKDIKLSDDDFIIGYKQIQITLTLDDLIKTITIDLSDPTKWIPKEYLNIDTNNALLGFKKADYDLSTYATLFVPDNVEKIAENAFFGETTLPDNIKSIIFSNESLCTSIGSFAFAKSKIINLRLPKSLNDIASYAFGMCKDLKNVILPINLNNIAPLSFAYDQTLENVYVMNDEKIINITQTGDEGDFANPFYSSNSKLKLWVSITIKYEYKIAKQWQNLGLDFNYL